MIQIFLSLLGFVLGSRIWSILVNVLPALEKNIYFAVVGWSAQ